MLSSDATENFMKLILRTAFVGSYLKNMPTLKDFHYKY